MHILSLIRLGNSRAGISIYRWEIVGNMGFDPKSSNFWSCAHSTLPPVPLNTFSFFVDNPVVFLVQLSKQDGSR